MTKPRPAGTPHHAMLTIADVLGWRGAAEVAERCERRVRRWSDPDAGLDISLIQASRLDQAYFARVGQVPPFEAWYCLQRQLFAARAAHALDALASDRVAIAARETGEALAARIVAAMPGAGVQAQAIADRETDEAILALALTRSAAAFGVLA